MSECVRVRVGVCACARCEKVITALHKFHRTLRKTNY